MKSFELTAKTIKGENTSRTPLYGWVEANLKDELCSHFGCVRNFEDAYEFDISHIFGGPSPYPSKPLKDLANKGIEITPDILLDIPLNPVNNLEDYKDIKEQLVFYRKIRERFCYVQTNGIFECLNGPLGIENHLCYLLLYPIEMKELYRRQAEWNISFAENVIELGADMIHISDDWGAQNSLLFSPEIFYSMIFPFHKKIAEHVKRYNVFLSLHSDGCIKEVIDAIPKIGYDVVHPWQESAGMDYNYYLKKYANSFALMGGLCVQTTLGFGDYKRVEKEILRVFSLLKGKRWICCTTHYIQKHCSLDELIFAFDLAYKLARE